MKQDLIQTYDMLPSGGTVLCAVSGGADSMCLLAWLLELGPKYVCAVAAAHYNHGLRGAQGDADEAFVRDWCAGHSVPFYAGRGDVASAAKEHGWSIEEAGRNLRYAFLSETAEQIGALRVATAHNRGDNAETVLLNLIRGTGLTGLSGIAPVRGIFVRPLLDTPRQEIEDYLAGRGIPHVEDRTNTDPAHTRNRIRHEVLPLLRQLNPRVEEALVQTAGVLRQEDAYLHTAAERVCRQVERRGESAALERKALLELPAALQGRVVRSMLDLLQISKKDIGARHIRAVLDLVRRSGPTAQISLPRGVVAKNDCDFFVLTAGGSRPWQCAALSPVGEAVLGPWRIECRVQRGAAEKKPLRLILNNAALHAPVCADRWRESGRMTLPGKDSSRSLKRLFVDAGLSVREREETPVIYVGGRPAAALFVGVDRAFAEKEREWKYILDFYKR